MCAYAGKIACSKTKALVAKMLERNGLASKAGVLKVLVGLLPKTQLPNALLPNDLLPKKLLPNEVNIEECLGPLVELMEFFGLRFFIVQPVNPLSTRF